MSVSHPSGATDTARRRQRSGVRGLTLGHLDATLRQMDAAERLLAGDIEAELARRGVEAIAYRA